jgi:anti-sigma factor RsiW
MDCHVYRLLIQRYYDGELDAVERAEYESHSRQCDACRAEDARFAGVFALLGAAPRYEPSSEFNARVLARVDVAAYRVGPLRKTARALAHLWNAVPVPLRNGAVIVGIFALFMAAYRPFLWYLVSVIERGADSVSSGMLFLRALAERTATVWKGSGALRQYEVAGQTLGRAVQKLFGGMHPHEIALLLVSAILIVIALYRTVAAARRKGETHVGIL